MKVILKPVSGSAEANLKRAKTELTRVLSFRGKVTRAKINGSSVTVEFKINPEWN